MTPLVTQRDLYVIARAIEATGAEFAADWGLDRPAVYVCGSPDGLVRAAQPVICTDKDEADTGFLAYHTQDRTHVTLSRAFVPNATGILTGTASLSESISHEVWEAMVDPLCDLWPHAPGRAPSVHVPYECCDPAQDAFVVRSDDSDVQISNWATPAWFRDDLADPNAARSFVEAGGKFDHLGTLSRAGQIGPEGYAVFKDTVTGETWLETATGRVAGSAKPGAAHPFARTARRLAA